MSIPFIPKAIAFCYDTKIEISFSCFIDTCMFLLLRESGLVDQSLDRATPPARLVPRSTHRVMWDTPLYAVITSDK